MSLALPPRARLAHVLRSLAAALPAQVGPLLDAPRFDEGRDALLRIAKDAAGAAAALAPEEAAWMADTLLARWALVADPVLEPFAAIVAPDAIWIGERAVRMPITVATTGVEDDWEAVWEGAVIAGPPAQTAVLEALPPPESGRAAVIVRARVRARARGGARVMLVAEAEIALRRPVLVVSDDARRFVVRDQAGDPAPGVEIEIGAARFVTGPGGLVELASPAEPGAAVRVQGILAGKVRGR